MKERSPVTSLLLSIFVPFYYLYWLYATGKIINTRGVKAPSILLMLAPFILLLSAVLLSFVGRLIGGDTTGLNVFIFIVGISAIPALIVLPIVFDYKFSKATEVATGGKVSSGVGFVLMLFVPPAAVYIFQDQLNETKNQAPQASTYPAVQPLQQTGSPAFASNQQPQQPVTPASFPQQANTPQQSQPTPNEQTLSPTQPEQPPNTK